MRNNLLGAVEAGGTKMVCAVAYELGDIIEEKRFPTTQAEETLAEVKEFFENASKKYEELGAIGYGTFGPAAVAPTSKDYGKVLATPKLGWEGADVMAFLSEAFPNAALSFDTDVNAAALGEGHSGAALGMVNYVYITVGTGIGGGVVIGGQPLHGNPHA
ncbi:MAG: ROK family protein, partial [Rubritalea sp.]|uniref:ROK family protein n=1 Tax=Rubritalea sp. TaxID=2109375 RepID=UPI0032427A93